MQNPASQNSTPASAVTRRIPVAIQLYSLRTVIADDLPGTLGALAQMGYEGVELAGYYGRSGAELRSLLDEAGLQCAGTHVGLAQLEGDALAETVAIHQALGTDRLIIPSANFSDLDGLIRRMNAAHAAAKAMGMRVGFHNHTKEFATVDGQTVFERIFDGTPDDFLVQVDIGWATAAGQDVPALLRRYGPRIETVHIKEYQPDDPTAAVGQGVIDWSAIMTVLETETATSWYVVEQEQYRVGPIESARDCIQHIRAIGR